MQLFEENEGRKSHRKVEHCNTIVAVFLFKSVYVFYFIYLLFVSLYVRVLQYIKSYWLILEHPIGYTLCELCWYHDSQNLKDIRIFPLPWSQIFDPRTMITISNQGSDN